MRRLHVGLAAVIVWIEDTRGVWHRASDIRRWYGSDNRVQFETSEGVATWLHSPEQFAKAAEDARKGMGGMFYAPMMHERAPPIYTSKLGREAFMVAIGAYEDVAKHRLMAE